MIRKRTTAKARCQQALWKVHTEPAQHEPWKSWTFRESTIRNLLVCKAFIITTRSFLLKNKSKHSNKKSLSCRCSIDYFGLRSVRSHSSPCFNSVFSFFFSSSPGSVGAICASALDKYMQSIGNESAAHRGWCRPHALFVWIVLHWMKVAARAVISLALEPSYQQHPSVRARSSSASGLNTLNFPLRPFFFWGGWQRSFFLFFFNFYLPKQHRTIKTD